MYQLPAWHMEHCWSHGKTLSNLIFLWTGHGELQIPSAGGSQTAPNICPQLQAAGRSGGGRQWAPVTSGALPTSGGFAMENVIPLPIKWGRKHERNGNSYSTLLNPSEFGERGAEARHSCLSEPAPSSMPRCLSRSRHGAGYRTENTWSPPWVLSSASSCASAQQR